MATKHDLQNWVLKALDDLGGSGSVTEVCRAVWNRREQELRESGDLFYTWQYDIRWAAQRLRNDRLLTPVSRGDRSWRIAK